MSRACSEPGAGGRGCPPAAHSADVRSPRGTHSGSGHRFPSEASEGGHLGFPLPRAHCLGVCISPRCLLGPPRFSNPNKSISPAVMSLRQADLSEKQQRRLTGGFSWSPRLPACRLRGLWGPLRQASAFQTVGRSYCKPGAPGARGGRPVTDAPLPGSSAVRSGQRDRVRRAALGLDSVGTKRPREKGGQGGTPRNSHDETGRGLGGRGLTFSCAKNHGSHAS